MDALVWVDDWQFECCGEPFSVGNRVTWSLAKPDTEWLSTVLGAAEGARVTHAEDHHETLPTVTGRGTIRAIREVHYRSAPRAGGDPRRYYPVEGSAELVEVVDANGWELPASGLGGLGGFLVDITFDQDMPLDTTNSGADG